MPDSKNYALTLLTAPGPVKALEGVVAENDADAIREASKLVRARYYARELSAHDTILIRGPSSGSSKKDDDDVKTPRQPGRC